MKLGDSLPLPKLRVFGLDIEQSVAFRNGSFPLPCDPLISIAIYSSDGRSWCRHLPGKVDLDRLAEHGECDVAKCSSSTEMVDWAIELLMSECPDIVAIHNGFRYDIPVMAAHCSQQWSYLFKEMNLGKKGKGADMNLPGTTVLDTYHYLSKLHGGEYESLSLKSLAERFKLTSKMAVETFDISHDDDDIDITDMIMYNVTDSYLHVAVALESRMIEEVYAMSVAFRSPLNDITRFISGTLVGLLKSSYARENGLVLQWYSEPTSLHKYKGGHVQTPIPGAYKNIAVLDFSSLYPNIVISANISPEVVRVIDDYDERSLIMDKYGIVDDDLGFDSFHMHYTDDEICLVIDDEIGVIDRTRPGLASTVMKYLVDKRNSLGDEGRNSPEGWALKIGANSYYGALGSSTSGLGMRFAAAAVTGIGRKLMQQLITFLAEHGLNVIYGDTDSVFVEITMADTMSPEEIESYIASMIESFHNSLDRSIYSTIKLSRDKVYKSLALLGPKSYYGIRMFTGKIDVKGMSAKRRDRLMVARKASAEVCNLIANHRRSGNSTSNVKLYEYLYNLYKQIVNGDLDFSECMMETKDAQTLVLKYKNEQGAFVTIEKDKFDPHRKYDISVQWIVDCIKASIDPILEKCSEFGFMRSVEEYEQMREHLLSDCDGWLND
jgi:DNA polymerase I